jgi:hypothetical protein
LQSPLFSRFQPQNRPLDSTKTQEIYELAHAELSAQAETGAEIAPFILKVGATSIAEIDRLLAELEEAKNYLQSEGRRIELEMAGYTNLTQMTSLTAKIISEAVSQWHPARNKQKSNASEVTAASTEDDIGVRTSGPPEGSNFST